MYICIITVSARYMYWDVHVHNLYKCTTTDDFFSCLYIHVDSTLSIYYVVISKHMNLNYFILNWIIYMYIYLCFYSNFCIEFFLFYLIQAALEIFKSEDNKTINMKASSPSMIATLNTLDIQNEDIQCHSRQTKASIML